MSARSPSRWALAVVVVCPLAAPAAAEAYLRVIAQEAPVHSGPGASYRTIYDARRDQVFEVVERCTRGYWFRVVLRGRHHRLDLRRAGLSVRNVPEDVVIVVADGGGAKLAAIQWLRQAASRGEKDIRVFTIAEFGAWAQYFTGADHDNG